MYEWRLSRGASEVQSPPCVSNLPFVIKTSILISLHWSCHLHCYSIPKHGGFIYVLTHIHDASLRKMVGIPRVSTSYEYSEFARSAFLWYLQSRCRNGVILVHLLQNSLNPHSNLGSRSSSPMPPQHFHRQPLEVAASSGPSHNRNRN